MPLKVWTAEIGGHTIRVTNTWLGGAKLFVDGECRDINKELFSVTAERPRLRARLEPNDNSSPLIEVFFKAIVTVRAKICADGKTFRKHPRYGCVFLIVFRA